MVDSDYTLQRLNAIYPFKTVGMRPSIVACAVCMRDVRFSRLRQESREHILSQSLLRGVCTFKLYVLLQSQ